MRFGNPVIAGHHFLAPVSIVNDVLDISNYFTGQAAVHFDHIKALGLDIILKDIIAVDQQRLLKVYRLKQGIAEALI